MGIGPGRSAAHGTVPREGLDWLLRDQTDVRRLASLYPTPRQQRKSFVNRIVWLVGAVVIILFVLGFLGLR
jgi:hypothetical protein